MSRSGQAAIAVRAAEPRDLPELLRMIEELAAFERLEDEVVATESSLGASLFSDSPSAHAAVGESYGAAAGFAVYYENFSTFTGRPGIHLEDLYVRPDSRGIGLGKAIFRWVARRAVSIGAPRLDWSVLDWNEGARGFYSSLGGKELSDWRSYRLERDELERLASNE